MIRVAVAEDSLLVREGIVRILDEAEGVEVVGAVGDAGALLALVDRAQPDAVRDRHPDAADTHRRGDPPRPPTSRPAPADRRRRPQPARRASYALALFEQGAGRRAYLLKERLAERGELVRALETVAAGGSLVDPGVIHGLVSAHVQQERPTLAALTPRGREILALIAEGASNSAIAERLVITKRAVERHINAIFQKLELEDSADVSRRVKAALVYLAATDD